MNETQVLIRVARSGDAEPVREFLAELSPASVYKRFFAPLTAVSPSLLRRLVTVTPGQLVLLALDGDTVVGHAMAVCIGEYTVDVGIVVADEHHHTGIGHRLMRELIDTVTRFGVNEVHSDVLSDNHLVLEWLRRLSPDMRFERSGPTVAANGRIGVLAA